MIMTCLRCDESTDFELMPLHLRNAHGIAVERISVSVLRWPDGEPVDFTFDVEVP
jgi:hypothetical protein